MIKKRGIRYLRISKEKQSNFSIDAQDMYTKGWFDRNDVEIAGTFIDDGYTAQNFDRPDFLKLEQFIREFHNGVDYLVVNSFDRFSRDAGEALMKIKQLQNKYSISVVSVVEGVTFDRNDPGSFFYTGLLLLKGEDELIRHKYRVNMGIYTAKKKFGRYIGSAPWGYYHKKDADGRPNLAVDPDKAEVIKFIYRHFLSGVPQYIILQDVKQMAGNFIKSNSAIKRVLTNPVYAGYLNVKGVRDLPGGTVDGAWEPIIDRPTWHQVQNRIGGGKPKMIVDDRFPLRGVLKCFCGLPVTGAPSRGKSGKYFNYYKCKKSHNNIAANKAHTQLQEAWKHLSLPEHYIPVLQEMAEKTLGIRLAENQRLLEQRKREIVQLDKQIASLEEKYINDKIQFETYNRWHTDYTQRKIDLRQQMERLGSSIGEKYLLISNEIQKLTDLSYAYEKASVVNKGNMIRLVFDSKLYYQEGVYRTPYIMPLFLRNTLILKEKNLLIYEKSGDLGEKIPSGGAGGIVIEHLTSLLGLIRQIA